MTTSSLQILSQGKGKVSHCFRRISDYSLYLFCVPGQPQGKLFDVQKKTEEGELLVIE